MSTRVRSHTLSTVQYIAIRKINASAHCRVFLHPTMTLCAHISECSAHKMGVALDQKFRARSYITTSARALGLQFQDSPQFIHS